MVETPVRASLSISSIFVARGIVFFSFCRPSRGPTSTSLTRLSYEVPALAVAKPLCQRSCPERRHARQMLDRKRLIVKVVVGLCLTGSGWFNCKREEEARRNGFDEADVNPRIIGFSGGRAPAQVSSVQRTSPAAPSHECIFSTSPDSSSVPRILLLYALDDWASNYYWGSKDCIDFIYYNTILGKQDWL